MLHSSYEELEREKCKLNNLVDTIVTGKEGRRSALGAWAEILLQPVKKIRKK